MEPPRLISPTTTRPPRRRFLSRLLHRAIRAADADLAAGLGGVEAAQLDRELVLRAGRGRRPAPWRGRRGSARRSGRSPGTAAARACSGCCTPAARAFVDLDAVQAGVLVHAAGADASRPGPAPADRRRCCSRSDSSGVATNFSTPSSPMHVAEVGVAELGGADALLLLLHPAAALQREAHRPFQVLVARPRISAVGIEQLQQAADGLVDGVGVAPAQGAAEDARGPAVAATGSGCAAGSSTRTGSR